MGVGGVGMGLVRVDMIEKISFCENSKKIFFFFGGGGGRGRVGGGQGGCERRIEVFIKIPPQKNGGGPGGRGRFVCGGGGSWLM